MKSISVFICAFLLGVIANGADLLYSMQMAKDTQSIAIHNAPDWEKHAINMNAPNGCFEVQTRQITGAMSFYAEVMLTAPIKNCGAIISRPGCHNYLAIAKDGGVRFTIWTIEPKREYIEIASRTHLEIGKVYQLASVLEENAAGEYAIVLYVDGKEETRKAVTGKLYQYPAKLFIGASNVDNKEVYAPFEFGKILKVQFYQGALDIDEINQLKGE